MTRVTGNFVLLAQHLDILLCLMEINITEEIANSLIAGLILLHIKKCLTLFFPSAYIVKLIRNFVLNHSKHIKSLSMISKENSI